MMTRRLMVKNSRTKPRTVVVGQTPADRAGVPLLTFASRGSEHHCECRNRRDAGEPGIWRGAGFDARMGPRGATKRLSGSGVEPPDVPDRRTLQACPVCRTAGFDSLLQQLVNHADQGLVNHAGKSNGGQVRLTSLFKQKRQTARARSHTSTGNIILAGRLKP